MQAVSSIVIDSSNPDRAWATDFFGTYTTTNFRDDRMYPMF